MLSSLNADLHLTRPDDDEIAATLDAVRKQFTESIGRVEPVPVEPPRYAPGLWTGEHDDPASTAVAALLEYARTARAPGHRRRRRDLRQRPQYGPAGSDRRHGRRRPRHLHPVAPGARARLAATARSSTGRPRRGA